MGIFNNFGASSIFLGTSRYCISCLSCAPWQSGIYPWLLLLSFVMLMILVQWILHRIQNRLLQYRLGIQLDLCILETVASTPSSWDDRGSSTMQSVRFCPHSFLQRSPHFCFWLSSAAIPLSSSIVHIFLLLPFAPDMCMAWSIEINLCTKVKWLGEFTSFPAMWSAWSLLWDPSMRILKHTSASTTQVRSLSRWSFSLDHFASPSA